MGETRKTVLEPWERSWWKARPGQCSVETLSNCLGLSPRGFCEDLLRDLRKRFDLLLAMVWTLDPVHNNLILLAAEGVQRREVRTHILHRDLSLSSHTVERRLITRYNVRQPLDGRAFSEPELIRRLGLEDMVSIPVLNISNPNQVLLVMNFFPRPGSACADNAELSGLADRLGSAFELNLKDQCVRFASRLGLEVAEVRKRHPDEPERWYGAVTQVVRDAVSADAVGVYIVNDDASGVDPRGTLGEFPRDEVIQKELGGRILDCWRNNREQLVVDLAEPKASAQRQAKQAGQSEYCAAFVPLRDLEGQAQGVICCLNSRRNDPGPVRRYFTYEDIAGIEAVGQAFVPLLEILIADERRSLSLTKLAHEMRVPVVAFRAAVERIQRECERKGYTFQFDHFGDLETYAGVMKRLLWQLDVVRKGPGHIRLEPKLVWLHREIIAPAVRFVAPLACRKELDPRRIKYASLREIPDLYLDVALMTQVVFNLLDNAIKYHGGDPDTFEVEIEGCETSDGFEVELRDRGIGVPAGWEERIFQAGVRGPESHMFDVAGEGLGLWFAREIVRCHGGDVTLRRNADPTTFVITLPHSLTDRPPDDTAYSEERP